MESLANVATAIGEPDLAESIRKVVAIKDENNPVNVANVKEDDWASLKQEGTQHYLHKRWEEAMNCYTRAIHLNQGEAGLYSNRALCELRLSKFDLAREDIEDAIQLEPENIKFYRILSKVLLKMNKYEESLAICLQGLKINPRDEVLNVRERDCRALIVPVLMDEPVLAKSFSILGIDCRVAMIPSYENLHLTNDDIENCRDKEQFCECSNLSSSLEKAYQFEQAATLDGERNALEIYKDAAEKGFAYGFYNMARFYNEEKADLPRNFHKAIELCRKAASRKAFIRFEEMMSPNVGVAEAEVFLGNCYRDGRGVDRCTTEAFKWYLKAARHNSRTGQNNLGLALLNGDGCPINEKSARDWFQKAAEHGLSEAQYNYAKVLEEGVGGPVDVKKAGEMLQLSADQDHAGAMERLQKLSRTGALGASAMEQTHENLCSKADKGDPISQYLVGQNYLNGTGGFIKDLHQAERHLRVASNCGYVDAHLPLGMLLQDQKRNEEAFEFIKLAAEKGSSEGQFQLGLLYNYGHGCSRDEAQARRWFNRAKMQGVILKCTPEGKLRGHDEWVDEMIDFGRKQCEFETKNQLKPDGLSLEGRKRRFDNSKLDPNDPDTPEYLKFLEAFFPTDGRPPRSSDDNKRKNITPEIMNELKFRAENGSITAQYFFKSRETLERARVLLKQKRTNEVFQHHRLSMREWVLPHPDFLDFYDECHRAALKALDRNSQDAEALYVLVRIGVHQSFEERLQMAKRCVELDPSVPDFHHLVADMCGFIQDHRNGLRAVDRALELLPSQTSWLYDRAGFIRMGEAHKYTSNSPEAYLKFLSSNPPDHPKVPMAYFYLAHLYVMMNELTKAKAFFQKGLEAEDPGNPNRLPCFEPVKEDFQAKSMTRMMIKGREWKVPLEQTDCPNCLKRIDQSLRCIACKRIWYCGRDCQVAHWKKHKRDCRRLNRS